MHEGVNRLVLACVQPPAQPLRAYAALLEPGTVPARDRAAARLTWFAEPSELVYDIAPDEATSVGWYRFEAPAGTHTLHVELDAGLVQVECGVANLGKRPTFNKQDVLLEVNLFDFSGDIYGAHLRVSLVGFIRPEQKFDGLDALKAQIAADAEEARQRLA